MSQTLAGSDAVIVDVVRTPSGRGKPGGLLSGIHPVDLLAGVLQTLVARNGLDPALIDDVMGGCVGQIGEQSANVTRQAVLAAGFPHTIPATTIDRQCGSSQQAVAFAAQAVQSGAADIVIACGVESMSRVPLGSSAAGADGLGPMLRARYPEGLVNQGVAAELIAARWGMERELLDMYSAHSHSKAAAAAASGAFDREIIAVPGIESLVDETVRAGTTANALADLKPAFYTEQMAERFAEIDWQITPGNSSPLTDGASAALIMSAERAEQLGLTPRARVHSTAVVGSDPLLMLTGVVEASNKVLSRARLTVDDLDAYEVNEAFAPVPIMWLAEMRADDAKLNVHGGASALGHALGSSATRLLATLVNHPEASSGRFGLQVMCEGGGMANATIIERV